MNTQLRFTISLLLMLGCRKWELLDSRWEDFDREKRSWRIPLSKSGKSRHVPLSDGALHLLAQIPRWPGCPNVVPNPVTWQRSRLLEYGQAGGGFGGPAPS